jgi:hypothetical protein
MTNDNLFSVDAALVWLELAKGPMDTFNANPGDITALCESYLALRRQTLLAKIRHNNLSAAFATLQQENADMRAALPGDWVPARIRNEQDALATAPQPVANGVKFSLEDAYQPQESANESGY